MTTDAASNRSIIVADAWCLGTDLVDALIEHLGADAHSDVVVLAPATTSWLKKWTNDTDTEFAEATTRLEDVLEQLRARDVDARGRVTDQDPLDDVRLTLNEFAADRVVLVTSEDDSSGTADGDLAKGIAELGLPVTHVTVAGEVAT